MDLTIPQSKAHSQKLRMLGLLRDFVVSVCVMDALLAFNMGLIGLVISAIHSPTPTLTPTLVDRNVIFFDDACVRLSHKVQTNILM